MSDDKELPAGWVWTTLGDVAELVGGGTPSREIPEYFTGDIVWLTPTEIPKDRIAVLSNSRERITEQALRKSSARLLPTGTVLMTSRATIGYVAIAGAEVTTNQGFASFICSDGVFNGYLAYWLSSQREEFIEQATGTTFKEITKSKLRPIEFPLAPPAEQRRIVAKIEELFTRLDAGVASLKRVQAALKRYKASVLKAACEGRLVPQDRADEPAEQLLARILAERRAKWEADQRAKGKDSKKLKYEEPQAPDTAGLPELPAGWCWASVGQIINYLQYGTSVKADADAEGSVPVIRMGNIQDGDIDYSGLKYIDPSKEDIDKYRLEIGDVLINRTNSAELVGKAGLFKRGAVFVFASYLIRLKTDGDRFLPEYLALYINSDLGRKHVARVRHQVAGQANINSEDIRSMPISVPPVAEQRRIVAEVERRLSVVAEVEQTVEDNLARAGRLRQAILHRAFTGRLV